MAEDIFNPDYWANRFKMAAWEHSAIYLTIPDQWEAIEKRHREILAELIQPTDSIFDAGCGWGRLLTLLPSRWHGDYLGVDLSPDFIAKAKRLHPTKAFVLGDLRTLPEQYLDREFDWAIMVSMRPMITENKGQKVWDAIEQKLRTIVKKLLYLEYREDDKGSVE